MNNERLADFFVDQGVMDRAQADDVLLETTQNGKAIEQTMVDHGIIDEAQFYQTIAGALGTEVVDLDDVEFTPEILHVIPAGLARLHRALPVGAEENMIRVALNDPLDTQTIEDLRFALGRDIQVVVALRRQIRERLKKHYGDDTPSMDDILKQLGEPGELMALSGDKAIDANVEVEANATPPIIRFVDLILYQAIRDGASDIHFEPFEAEFKVRYRVDGALYEMAPPPRHLALPVISRVKVMANMNIAERRLPQDGRLQKNIAGRAVDLRVSTLPTQFGESVVLRVLDRSTVDLDLESLGMPDDILNYVLEVIDRPNGIFIVTGPTGAGKTTTLYSCLRKINTTDSKLLTAEEPVEYDLEGVMHFLQELIEGLLVIRQLHVRPVRIRFGSFGGRARCRLIERFRGALYTLHFKRRRRSFLQSKRRRWLKAGLIEEKAKHSVQREGYDKPNKEPVALLAPARPDGQRRGSSCGHGMHP